jgi:hypothetical protein
LGSHQHSYIIHRTYTRVLLWRHFYFKSYDKVKN